MNKRFKLQQVGSDHAILNITGDVKNCEPAHVSLRFPGGEVTVVRATDGEGAPYWVHFTRFRPNDCSESESRSPGVFLDARIDNDGKATNECDVGDFGDPETYHVAIKIGTAEQL